MISSGLKAVEILSPVTILIDSFHSPGHELDSQTVASVLKVNLYP